MTLVWFKPDGVTLIQNTPLLTEAQAIGIDGHFTIEQLLVMVVAYG